MKKTGIIFLILLVFGCGEDEGSSTNSLEETQLQRLAGSSSKTWVADTITFENASPTQNFDGFMLTLNRNGTYSTVNGDPAFLSNGVWELKGEGTAQVDINTLIKDGDTTYEVQVEVNDAGTALTLTFDVPTKGGRYQGTGGTYVFDFELQ